MLVALGSASRTSTLPPRLLVTDRLRRNPTQERDVGQACARLAVERQARDVRLLYVGERLGIADWFVLATVNNLRQARAVCEAVRVGLKELGYGVPSSISEDPEGRWSLYDYGGVVLHLFDDEGREFFDLDSMWADVPVEKVEDPLAARRNPRGEPA